MILLAFEGQKDGRVLYKNHRGLLGVFTTRRGTVAIL